MKNGLRQKIMTKIAGLRPKVFSYLIDDCSEDKNKKKNRKSVL